MSRAGSRFSSESAPGPLYGVAGADGLDPRQPAGLRTEAYTKQLTGDAHGLRIGKGLAGPIPSPMSTPWYARRRSA